MNEATAFALLQMVNAYSNDDEAATRGAAPLPSGWWGRLQCAASRVPHRAWIWVDIAVSQLLLPEVDLLGHACGAMAGAAFVHLSPHIASSWRVLLRTLRLDSVGGPRQRRQPRQQRQQRRRRWRELLFEAAAFTAVLALGGPLARQAGRRRRMARR